MLKAVHHQFLRFLLVGGLATLLHYVILVALVTLAGSGPVVATSAGFVCGAVLNYLANRRLTFASDRPHRQALPRFAVVALTGLLLNAGVMWLLTTVVAWHYLLAQVAATVVTLFWNFTLNRVWTFGAARLLETAGSRGCD